MRSLPYFSIIYGPDVPEATPAALGAAFDYRTGMHEQIVVISPSGERLRGLLDILSNAGYRACGARTFDEAKRTIERTIPELVIAEERLGDFNGLHLVMLGRARDPEMKGIVIGRQNDRGLENDARQLNVRCLAEPRDAADWLASIAQTLESDESVTEDSSFAHAREWIH